MVVPKILTTLTLKFYSCWGKYDTVITTNSSSGAWAMLFSLPNPNTTQGPESYRGESSAQSTSLWCLHETYVFGVLSGIWLKVEVLSLYYWKTSILSIRLSVQFSSVAQSCPTLCDPMNRSMPGLPVHHQLPESTQTHVYWVGDAIRLSRPLSSPSSPARNLSQQQSLLQWVSSSHQVAKVLEFQLQHQSFQQTPSIDLL